MLAAAWARGRGLATDTEDLGSPTQTKDWRAPAQEHGTGEDHSTASMVAEGPRGAPEYQDDKGQLCCWVDGSKKDDKVGGAVYFGWKNPLNQTFRVVGTQSSFNMELQAVEMALAVAPRESIHIFSNNKAVCGLVEGMTTGSQWISRRPTL